MPKRISNNTVVSKNENRENPKRNSNTHILFYIMYNLHNSYFVTFVYVVNIVNFVYIVICNMVITVKRDSQTKLLNDTLKRGVWRHAAALPRAAERGNRLA